MTAFMQNVATTTTHPLVLLEGLVQEPPLLVRPPHQLLPPQLYRNQQVLDVHCVLLAAEIFEVGSGAVEILHDLSVGFYVFLKTLKAGFKMINILDITRFTSAMAASKTNTSL